MSQTPLPSDAPQKQSPIRKILPYFGITAICGFGLGWVETADLSDDTKAGVSAALMFVSLIPHGVAMLVIVFTVPKHKSFGHLAAVVGTYWPTVMLFALLGYLSAGLLRGKWG